MVDRKSSRVNDMSYSYKIQNKKVFELEHNGKLKYDKFGHNISFLIQNRDVKEMMSPIFKRKMDWLIKNHPEEFI